MIINHVTYVLLVVFRDWVVTEIIVGELVMVKNGLVVVGNVVNVDLVVKVCVSYKMGLLERKNVVDAEKTLV
tara:strand:+ start:176 stop:391 length:216 start_codon:yes stop_codon:yes gene_type:complete